MTFLTPGAALLAGAIVTPLLVLLYFLKLRRRVVVVSSTLLWKKSIEDLQVNSPFQKLRRNLLLLLQLLLLAMALIAFARPTTKAQADTGKRLVLVIDHSASMNATDVAPTRLELAKKKALALVDDLPSSAMVIAFAHNARVLQPFTSDRTLLRAAIDSIQPTDQRSNLEPALQLIEPFAMESAAVKGATAPSAAAGPASAGGGIGPLVVHLFTDGRVQALRPMELPASELRFERIGLDPAQGGGDNVGIAALSARRDYDNPRKVQVFARVVNSGQLPVDTHLSVRVDHVEQRTLKVKLDPAAADGTPGAQSVQFDMDLTGSALITVAHDHKDFLGVDDIASVLVPPPEQLAVLVVTEGNAFLSKVIEAVNHRKPAMMTPERYEKQDPERLARGVSGPGSGYDLIVFDRYNPGEIPKVDSLYFGAAPPLPGLRLVPFVAGEPGTQVVLDWARDHPMMRWVTMDDVVLSRPGRLIVPDAAEVLAVGLGGPMVAALSHDGRRHVVASFGILDSNWPMQVSFAVFMDNLIQTLGLSGSGQGLSFRTGEVATIRVNDSRVAKLNYAGPVPLSASVEKSRATLPMFERAGVYVNAENLPPPWFELPVSLLDETESTLTMPDKLQVGTVAVDATGQSGRVRQEIWRWFLWAALALLMAEWLVFTRRMHV